MLPSRFYLEQIIIINYFKKEKQQQQQQQHQHQHLHYLNGDPQS